MSHRANRFTTAVLIGAATGIAAGLFGVLAGGYGWALIFIGPFLSGILIVWSNHVYAPVSMSSAVVKGAGAGLAAGVICLMALPAYLAIWQEVSLLTVYNPLYWLTHHAEISEEMGTRAGWCAVFGSLFAASCTTAGGLSGLLASFVPQRTVRGDRPVRGDRRARSQ